MSTEGYKDKGDFVEEFSLKFEELGYPRIYGQILGWLLICDPPHQSFPDLMDNLEISKASVSNVTRMMLETGLIEKVRLKGERQIYFKLREGSLVEFMEKQVKLMLDLQDITLKGLNLVKDDPKMDISRLERANHFQSFIGEELPALLQKFKAENDL